MGTGVAAGGAVWATVPDDPYQWDLGLIAAITGLLVILAWGWWPITRDLNVVGAVLAVLMVLPATIAATIAVAGYPYSQFMCADSTPEDYCGLGVMVAVPTALVIVPWTLAGIPGLIFLANIAGHRGRRSAPR
ncbi:hypothetical protein [Williamsia sp. 1135]|uniref:hypothetical protein n=1 Tax=Williamsia sp. 1135 TaxID=1889262 RepID=UPI000A103DE3|nr:hypothetical protein [Williamsia sp. 1135]ORM38103.1 hypothetical protein BFL43_01330 [Williamsia sp. 1135]